jgi:transcriptional regulator with XRE-family HTH domain
MPLMPNDIERGRAIEREVRHRLLRIERRIGDDALRLRTDAGATKARVASIAGVDRTFLGRIESGLAHPSLETLIAIATAMGAEVSVRLYAGSGPRLTDRHQARMMESVLARLARVWRPHLEVAVWRPARGVIDGVFERVDDRLLVVSEFMSTLPRLEQQLRWSAEKAASIGSSELVRDGPVPPVSRLLVLRSTAATRKIARQFELTLRTSYPARTADAVRSLCVGDAWPGDAIVWVRIDGDVVELMDSPPRGVSLGR